MKRTQIPTRREIEKKYEVLELNDYKLHTLDQLYLIHGVDVSRLKGYDTLSEKNRKLFDKVLLYFYNVRGLDSRIALDPKCIHMVKEINYDRLIPEEERYDPEVIYESIGQEIYVVDDQGKLTNERLHKYVFEAGVSFDECKKFTKTYMRFELSDEWFHILPNGQFY